MDMDDVNAATASNKKNRIQKKYPPGICWNTLGKVMKTNPGPAPGSMPNANTAGKMAMPANSAIPVSAMVT